MKKSNHMKSLGLHKAHDHGAGMQANAAALMPEIANMLAGAGGGGGGMPPPPVTAASAPPPGFKKGGKVACFAKGGAGKLRKGEMTKSGAPAPAKVKARAVSGRGC